MSTEIIEAETLSAPEIVETQPRSLEGVNTMQAVRFRIAGDTISKGTAELPEEQRILLRWFGGYLRNRNLGKDDIARLLKKDNGSYYSYDSVYQALTGRRSEAAISLDPLCRAIKTFREQVEGVSVLGDSGYIPTRLGEIITERCDRAREARRISFIFGESQIGKSEELKQYQRTHNHGETIYVEVPTGGSLYQFHYELALSLAIPANLKQADLRRRLIDAFDPSMLLLVDEAHRSLRTGLMSYRGLQVFDFIRELYNRKRCGIVISMTNEGRDLFKNGPQRKALEQLWKRRIAPLQLPSTPLADDLDKFAMAYGLEPADDKEVAISIEVIEEDDTRRKTHKESPLQLQTRVVKNEGLGVWLMLLQQAANIAKRSRRPITWGAVIKAYCEDQASAEIVC